MKNIAIFYASSTGSTKKIADEISIDLAEIKEYNIRITGSEYMTDYDNIIFGISTLENGKMQSDWEEIWKEFCELDFKNKDVAIFSIHNQVLFPDNFVDSMGELYIQLKKAGANIIGFTSVDGYNFNNSKALIDGDKFVGLALDINNQNDLTSSRIENWVNLLKKDFF